MDARRHVLFRIDNPDLLASGGLGPAVSAPPIVSLTAAELTSAEVAEARAMPNVVPAAPMRTKLIEPLDAEVPAELQAQAVTWGVQAVGALDSPFTGAGVKVAVLDTGIKKSHIAFAGVTITERDFTGEGNGDAHGHGTHCAGTILGRDVSGTRIGVAPGVAELLVGKVLGANGGSTEALVNGIMWALQEGASVISMSIGIDFPGHVADLVAGGMEQEAATSEGLQGYRDNVRLFSTVAKLLQDLGPFGSSALVIAASGNESRRTAANPYTIDASPPAVAEGIISVGAVGRTTSGKLTIAPFSNTGPKLVGPGVQVASAGLNGGLTAMSGTSMATPHVAGVAALWAEQRKQVMGTLDVAQLASFIVAQTQQIPGLSPVDGGSGLARAPQL